MTSTPTEAIKNFYSHDLLALGTEAESLRARLHPEGVVTYCVLRPGAENIPTTATMLLLPGQTLDRRVQHLEQLQRRQQETGQFRAFALLCDPSGPEAPTAVEYLKMLAISRLYLTEIPNIEADWSAQGPKVLQMALRFGANDAGVLRQSHSGRGNRDIPTEEDYRRIIRDAGLRPVARDPAYSVSFLS